MELVVPDALVLGDTTSYHLVRIPGLQHGAQLTTTFIGYRRAEIKRFLARLQEYNVTYSIIRDVVQ